MTAPMSLRAFLGEARVALRGAIEASQKVSIVIGNESADLDSLSSSMLLAYIRTLSSRLRPSKLPFRDHYIPLLNIPTADITIRPEFLSLLKHAGLEPSHLITLDDLPQENTKHSLQPENTRWILVDHNVLQGSLGSIYGGRVRGVIDHHEDEDTVPEDTGDEPRIIEKSGSCASLVTNYCQQAWDELSSSAMTSRATSHMDGPWDAPIAIMALAAVLIDTSNLTSAAKTTEHDIKAVQYLESKLAPAPHMTLQKPVRKGLYKELNSAKRTIDHLSLQELLRKDYKQWSEQDDKRLGISTIVKPISWLCAKASQETTPEGQSSGDTDPSAFLDGVHSYAMSRNLDVCAIMTTFKAQESGHQRELFIWALDQACVPLMQGFERMAGDLLRLQEKSEFRSSPSEKEPHQTGWRKFWRQADASQSRKQVAPLIRKALNSGAGTS
ncbi:MAG: Exopolyphosphatase [Thelocarpon superellum]|nr:MAG: Exopolyphosphatase [Thelocarpon superellum]